MIRVMPGGSIGSSEQGGYGFYDAHSVFPIGGWHGGDC